MAVLEDVSSVAVVLLLCADFLFFPLVGPDVDMIWWWGVGAKGDGVMDVQRRCRLNKPSKERFWQKIWKNCRFPGFPEFGLIDLWDLGAAHRE